MPHTTFAHPITWDAHLLLPQCWDWLSPPPPEVHTTAVRLSEGRGQNNQQPTPNDNNKRVVVFLCGSGI